MNPHRTTLALLLTLAAVLAQALPANAQTAQTVPTAAAGAGAARPGVPVRARRDNPVTSVQEFVRIDGYSKSPLRGVGIVVGLPGTGDAGTELALARPLAEVYRNNGVPLADLKDLAKSKSAAIVMVTVDLPEEGGKRGDTFDVSVQALHSAKSIKGGTLLISPLMGPLPGQGVYAMATGPIVTEDAEVPTSGRIRLGAQLVQDVRPRPPGDVFNLILRPHFRSFAVARTIAAEINGLTADLESDEGGGQIIATAVDDSTIRINVPKHERSSPANFIANILTRRFSPSLIDLPAMVVVNERTGSIIVTGDVEISAVTVGNDKLVITTTTPPPVPTETNPLSSRSNWTDVGTASTTAERARIQDLLEAFKHLNVPVKEQISILAQIHTTGRLHARFVRE